MLMIAPPVGFLTGILLCKPTLVNYFVKRCPDLPIVPPSMEKYRQVARQIFAIYHSYTPLVEPYTSAAGTLRRASARRRAARRANSAASGRPR